MLDVATKSVALPDDEAVQRYLVGLADDYLTAHPLGDICLLINIKGGLPLGMEFSGMLDDLDTRRGRLDRVHYALVGIQSYGDSYEAGTARVTLPLSKDDEKLVRRCPNLVFFEDIVDTGVAADYALREYLPRRLGKRIASRIKFIPIFEKPITKRKIPAAVCPVPWNRPIPVPDQFVVGCGMGAGDQGRLRRGLHVWQP